MMSIKTIVALAIGTLAMLILMIVISIKYRVKLWKCIPTAITLTVVGTVGTYIMFFIENSVIEGCSYYGAVFIVPIVFIYFAKLIRIPYGDLMDLCAPAECVMLAIMKCQCLLSGCCGGKVMYLTPEGHPVLFPSQIAELINALVIMSLLVGLAFVPKLRGKLYPLYLVIYGVTRFTLNMFRMEQFPLLAGLTPGCLWSLVAIFFGILWLMDRKIAIVSKKKPTKQPPVE